MNTLEWAQFLQSISVSNLFTSGKKIVTLSMNRQPLSTPLNPSQQKKPPLRKEGQPKLYSKSIYPVCFIVLWPGDLHQLDGLVSGIGEQAADVNALTGEVFI